jgi:hypothetical protein
VADPNDRRSLGQRAREAEQRRKGQRETLRRDPEPVDETLPSWYRSLPQKSTLRWMLVIFFGIVVLTIVRSGHAKPPALATNCTTPGLALSTSSVSRGGTVRWAGTGPARQQVVLAIGVQGFKTGLAPKQLTAIPDAGRTAADVEQASALIRFDAGCRTSGVFSALVPPGHYQVRLFQVGSGVVRSVASQPLTVK